MNHVHAGVGGVAGVAPPLQDASAGAAVTAAMRALSTMAIFMTRLVLFFE